MESFSIRSPAWYYIGEDALVHGPHCSENMLNWCSKGYFLDNHFLRTENDVGFYYFKDWKRACGNAIPFALQILSMDSLCAVNGFSCPPPVSVQQTLAQKSMAGSHQMSSRSSFNGFFEPTMLQNQNGPVMSNNSIMPMNAAGNFAPPLQNMMSMQQSYDNNPVYVPQYPDIAGMQLGSMDGDYRASSTTEEHGLLNYPARNRFMAYSKFTDSSDMPWNRRSHKGTDPIIMVKCGSTQTDAVHLPRNQVEHALSEMLGFKVIISDSTGH